MTFLYQAFGYLLYLLYTFVHNYGVAIILFTVFWKLILLPLNIKSTKSMREMQALQPVMTMLQKKYKNNPEKLNIETQKLYKQYKVNPLGGCLPLLLQLPIIYALFGALREPAKYVFSGISMDTINQSFLWIQNLGNPDPYYILPILCGVFTFITQKFTMSAQPSGGDQSAAGMQNTMLWVMPIMIGFMAISMPAGVSLYWVVQNIFTFVQQYLMLRKPVATVDVYEAERVLDEAERKKKKELKEKRQANSQARQDMMSNRTGKSTKKTTGSSVKMTPASGKKVKRNTITKIPERKD